MKPGRTRILSTVTLLAVASVFGWFVRPVWIAHATVISSLPSHPDFTPLPSAFSNLIDQTETAAHSYSHPERALAELARLYHANAFYVQADECYRGLRKLAPGEPRWPYLEANILAGFGRLREALPLLQRTIELAPGYIPARLRTADALRKTDRQADAAAEYKEVLIRDTTNAYALLGLALCDLANNDWETTREHLRQCVTAQPGFFGGWSLLVTVHDHFGETELAVTARRKAAAASRFRDFADPWLEELPDYCYDDYRLSVAAGGASDHTSARRWLERAISLAPRHSSYHRQLGTVLFQDKNYAEARLHLEQAVKLNADDGDAWALLVGLLVTTGDFSGAETALSTGLARSPQSGPLHYENGQRLKNMARYQEAIAELEIAKKIQPHDARAYIELAMIDFQLNRPSEGMVEMKAAVIAEPGNPAAVQLLARHAIKTGDEVEAREWMRQLSQFPSGSVSDLEAILGDYTKRFGRSP